MIVIPHVFIVILPIACKHCYKVRDLIHHENVPSLENLDVKILLHTTCTTVGLILSHGYDLWFYHLYHIICISKYLHMIIKTLNMLLKLEIIQSVLFWFLIWISLFPRVERVILLVPFPTYHWWIQGPSKHICVPSRVNQALVALLNVQN